MSFHRLSLIFFMLSAAQAFAQGDDSALVKHSVRELRLYVYDRTTDQPITSKAELILLSGDVEVYRTGHHGNDTLPIVVPLPQMELLVGRVSVPDHLTMNFEVLPLDGVVADEDVMLTKEIFLPKVISCPVFITPDILFEYGSAELSPSNKDSLTMFTAKMDENPTMTIEIIGHREKQEVHGLDELRGRAVLRYMEAQGIQSGRLSLKPVGQEQPRISEKEISRLTSAEERAAARALNRCVGLMVTGFNYMP